MNCWIIYRERERREGEGIRGNPCIPSLVCVKINLSLWIEKQPISPLTLYFLMHKIQSNSSFHFFLLYETLEGSSDILKLNLKHSSEFLYYSWRASPYHMPNIACVWCWVWTSSSSSSHTGGHYVISIMIMRFVRAEEPIVEWVANSYHPYEWSSFSPGGTALSKWMQGGAKRVRSAAWPKKSLGVSEKRAHLLMC